MSEGEKPNLLIIGNLHSHPSCEAFLRKFLKILYPLSSGISLISGDLPSDFDGKIRWIKTVSVMNSRKSILIRLINFILKQLRVTFNMIKLFREGDISILIFLVFIPTPMLFAKLVRKKILLYRGGSVSKEIFRNEKHLKGHLLIKIFEDLPCMLSDKLILESESSLEFQNIEKYRDKVTVGSLYVDSNMFSCKNMIKKRKERIGFIGILNENKGVTQFSKAVIMIGDYLNEKSVEVIIGGDGPLFSSIRELIETSDLSKRVTLLGWISHEKLPECLNELKLLVLPSYSEGLPNIILEAMACGTPVLATPIGSIPDVIKDGVTGFIMANNSPECIAENITRALEHSKLDEIAKNARKIVEKEFTYEAAVGRYRMILQDF